MTEPSLRCEKLSGDQETILGEQNYLILALQLLKGINAKSTLQRQCAATPEANTGGRYEVTREDFPQEDPEVRLNVAKLKLSPKFSQIPPLSGRASPITSSESYRRARSGLDESALKT